MGIAQGAYEAALKYSKQRKQFSRFISEFQAIQHKLADMATEIDASRLLTQRAAWLKDSGASVNKESAMAKLFASETAVRVTNEAVQIHGGYGFIKDYPVEKFFRDAKLCTIGEGTSEIQRLVIARQLLKEPTDGWIRSRKSSRATPARWPEPRRWIENRRPEAEALLKELFPHTGRALILGITGPARSRQEHSRAISSRAKLREQEKDRRAFSPSIPPAPTPAARSWATASACSSITPIRECSSAPWRRADGWAGWRAPTTEMTMLLDAAGFDVVMVETVGVGQDEVEIARLADVTAGGAGAGHGRRCAGDQSRYHGNRRRVRHQQSRPAWRRQTGERAEGLAPRQGRENDRHATAIGIDEALAAIAGIRTRKSKDPARAAQIWSGRLREMLRDRLLDRIPAEEFLSRRDVERRRPIGDCDPATRFFMTVACN